MLLMSFRQRDVKGASMKREASPFQHPPYYRDRDIRQQLNEQLKCLDARLESHMAMLGELQEFYRQRAEVELNYSKALDRLVKQIMQRHKVEKTRRELWPGYSTYTCWQTLLASTKRQSKDHSILSEIYTSTMSNRFAELIDDIQRIYKTCREIGFNSHEELLKVLHELQSSMKTYHVYHGESKQAETKLRHTESQKSKVEQHASKGTLSRKFKSMEKQAEKRQAKYTENKLKALKARNDYILCIDAANAAMNKYFMEDLPDLIDAMDFGYHTCLSRAMMNHISAEENIIKSRQACTDLMSKCVNDLDQGTDKQRFLEVYNQAFSLPKKFEFQAHKGDEVCQISAQKSVQEELIERHKQINKRLTSCKLENDELWKTLETAEKSLSEKLGEKDYDTTPLFQEEKIPPKSPIEYHKKRSDRLETEAFYLEKFKGYLLSKNLITRLQAKSNSIQKALGEGAIIGSRGVRPPSLPPKPKKRKIGKTTHPVGQQPKLFGGSIEEYTEATGQEMPRIITSCVRVINLYGMHHQGVFRVSGSQHEINDFKNRFEKGEDPLLDISDGKDINSVAGVLKLYFRELKKPLFPVQLFDELMACTRENVAAFTERIRELFSGLPRSIIVVMRYLMAFLHHLTEYSDENMMDPFNLAVCFGPTLIPIPPERDQVLYQSNVNELVKNIIMYQEDIFPNDGGTLYEKCMSNDDEDRDDTGDTNSDEEDVTDAPSEEESEVLEAIAQYDFTGRTDRELSFKKGELLVVFNQVSSDWWEGAIKGKEGLIPDKYILIKHSKDDDGKSAGSLEEEKHRSTESLPAKPYLGASLTVEDIDKCASQPNISLNVIGPDTEGTDTGSNRSSFPPSTNRSLLSSSGIGSSPSLSPSVSHNTEAVSPCGSVYDNDILDTTTDDLQQDIDSALAEVMSGLKSLETQTDTDDMEAFVLKEPPPSNPRHTPDLVLDLPKTTEPASPKNEARKAEESPTLDSPMLTTAEVFGANDQCTIKKGASMPRTIAGLFDVEMESKTGSPVKRSMSSTATMKSARDQFEKKEKASPSLRRRATLEESPKPLWIKKAEECPKTPPPAVPERMLQNRAASASPTMGSNPSTAPMSRSLYNPGDRPERPAKPDLPGKPKPPLRVKPQLMKKPSKSPEIVKRSNRPSESGDSGLPS